MSKCQVLLDYYLGCLVLGKNISSQNLVYVRWSSWWRVENPVLPIVNVSTAHNPWHLRKFPILLTIRARVHWLHSKTVILQEISSRLCAPVGFALEFSSRQLDSAVTLSPECVVNVVLKTPFVCDWNYRE